MKQTISVFLFFLFMLLSAGELKQTQKYSVRAEDGLKELIKDEVRSLQANSVPLYTLSTAPSGDEFIVISARKEKNALETRPFLRHGVIFLVNPENTCGMISKTEAEKILKNEFHTWPETGIRVRNVYYLKGMFDPGRLPAKNKKTHFNSLPFADLADKLLKQDPGAVAILPLAALTGPPDAKILAVDGIAPDFGTVTGGRYPMQKLYYLQRMKNVPEAKAFMYRLLSPEFKENILRFGAIPVPEEKEK